MQLGNRALGGILGRANIGRSPRAVNALGPKLAIADGLLVRSLKNFRRDLLQFPI